MTTSFPLPPRALHHVALRTPDVPRLEAFYAGVLGFAVTRRQAHAVWLDAGGVILMLEQCVDAPLRSPWRSEAAGFHLLAFAIAPSSRSAWRARLIAAGCTLEGESAYTTYVRDPDGNRLGFSHYPDPEV